MSSTRHVGSVLLACLLWGTTGTVAHFAPAGASATLIGLSTFGFGGLLLVATSARATLAQLRRPGALGWAVVGAIGVLMYASMFYAAMAVIGVAIGNAVALGSGPVFAAVLEVALDRARVALPWLVATLLAVAGIALLASAAHVQPQATGPGPGAILGVGLGLGAGFGYALYSYVGGRLIRDGGDSRPVMASMFGLSCLVTIPWFFLAGPGPLLDPPGPVILLYLAVFPMAVAYLLFGYGLSRLTASTATTLALSEPLVATLLAVVVVGERLALTAWLGLALVFAGIVLVGVWETRSGPARPHLGPGI